jgi:hypothetical protein
MRSLLVVFAVGCGSPPPVVTTPPPARVPAVAPVRDVGPLAIPAPAPLASTKQHCSPVVQPGIAIGGKVRVYEFAPVKLAPNATHPIPVGYRRHADSIRAAVAAEADAIASCTQEASRRGVRTTRFPAHFELATTLLVDPFGVPTTVTVEGDGDAKMRDCIRGVLSLARVARRTPRETLAKVSLYLLGSADKKLPKPAPVRAKPRTDRAGCVLAIDPLPRDTVDVPEVVIHWLPGDYSNPRQRCAKREPDKAEIRRVMEDNRYAFEACFAAAPDTRGQLDMEFLIGSHGLPTSLILSGADALHACITAAMKNVGFTRTDPIRVTWAFTLDATPPPTPLDDCAGRVALASSYTIHDPRAWTVLGWLATSNCELPDTLDRFARLGISDTRASLYRGRGTEEAIDTTTKMLALFPAAAQRLLLFLAEAHLSLGREGDARTTFLHFLALPANDPKQIERAAEGYALAVAERDDLAPLDFCEESASF